MPHYLQPTKSAVSRNAISVQDSSIHGATVEANQMAFNFLKTEVSEKIMMKIVSTVRLTRSDWPSCLKIVCAHRTISTATHHGQLFVGRVIVMNSKTELPEIVATTHSPRCLPGGLNGR